MDFYGLFVWEIQKSFISYTRIVILGKMKNEGYKTIEMSFDFKCFRCFFI